MKKSSLLLCSLLALLLTAACTYVPRVGMKETKWLNNTISYDLVYMQGAVKAYRSDGAYYYFKSGKLVVVTQTLIPAEKIEAGN